MLASFQDADFFTPRSRERYETLARSAALVGALGFGLGDEPAPGVRGAGLREDEALVGEWDVAVVGPHFAGAFVARDLGDTARTAIAASTSSSPTSASSWSARRAR